MTLHDDCSWHNSVMQAQGVGHAYCAGLLADAGQRIMNRK